MQAFGTGIGHAPAPRTEYTALASTLAAVMKDKSEPHRSSYTYNHNQHHQNNATGEGGAPCITLVAATAALPGPLAPNAVALSPALQVRACVRACRLVGIVGRGGRGWARARSSLPLARPLPPPPPRPRPRSPTTTCRTSSPAWTRSSSWRCRSAPWPSTTRAAAPPTSCGGGRRSGMPSPWRPAWKRRCRRTRRRTRSSLPASPPRLPQPLQQLLGAAPGAAAGGLAPPFPNGASSWWTSTDDHH